MSETLSKFIAWGIGLLFVSYFANRFWNWFQSIDSLNSYLIYTTGGPDGWYANGLILLARFVELYIQLSTIISALFILGIAYAYMRWWQIKQAGKKKAKTEKSQQKQKDSATSNAKWLRVVAHANSQNAAEWRLSILEADVLLDELLTMLRIPGETLGEKLKNADFKTIQLAWEAHKVRNAIAHEGADFLVTQREAQRVVGLYGQVFKEFDFI